ncbi:MAG: outer membrane receptor protein involved in Fe transport [Glaciecola sp.]|jgi:iron complex outermembrane receptor protein
MKTKTLRHHINGGAVALLAATTLPLSSFVAAQSEDLIEEVIVTGSRIARDSNLTGTNPIQSVSAEDIRASGEFSLTDVVNDIPSLLSSVSSEQSIDDGGNTSDGANVLNLRGLGAERTLVLVNGRRHVGGVQGTGAVDIGSIPQGLVERVEVLTGGASAVYGADAVTGVVNFILKDDFEGLEFGGNFGMSEYRDGQQSSMSVLFGRNFADGRGNFTAALDVRNDEGLKVSDRSDGLRTGSGGNWVNPDLRFQTGEITTSTPNFARFFDFAATGAVPVGSRIPTSASFAQDYTAQFGAAPSLTSQETALINRAGSAPQRAVLPFRTFPFTSGYGQIIPGNPFTFNGFDPETPIDLNNNGNPDCLDSFTGAFAVDAIIGGCWSVGENGSYAPVQEGLIASGFQGFGGDAFTQNRNNKSDILLPDQRATLNFLSHYDLTDQMTVFGELKYSNQTTSTETRPSSFWDLLLGAPDNPYLPDFIQDVANATGGVAITIDPVLFDATRSTERDTYRFVGGIKGEFDNSWTYELSVNYGNYQEEARSTGSVINDRFFAAIDATTDASGQPACRSTVDPTTPAQNTPFNIPSNDPGYFSFTPGDGTCVPLNIWAGQPGVTQAAADWVTADTFQKLEIEQTVFLATISGDSSDFFELPGGPVGFATGVEYREEKATSTFDNLQLGIIPAGAPFAQGTQLSDVSGNANLVFRPALGNNNESGSYDTTDFFLETSLPLLSDVRFAEELTVNLAGRASDYSTIGSANAWEARFIWSPIESLSLRYGISEAVRAPNITELFGPQVGTTFRPNDPCDAAQITAIGVEDPSLAASTQANCIATFQAIGLDPFDANGAYAFADPLSASFGGLAGGNPNLTEETADTVTYGFVFQPSFLDGFSLTVDYYDIEIENAIESVTGQDIVDGCYQAASLNPAFCGSLTRSTDSGSPQFGGFNFLQSSDINFSRLETAGYDLTASYSFDFRDHNFEVSVTGNKVNKLDFFTNPTDPSVVNPELTEINRPEYSGNVFLGWNWGELSIGWQSQYLGEMLESEIEVETANALYGRAVLQGDTWIHDLNATYLWNDQLTVFGGINNVTQEVPFITTNAFPASPRGRMLFLGANYTL